MRPVSRPLSHSLVWFTALVIVTSATLVPAQAPARVDVANLAGGENIYSSYPFHKPLAMTRNGNLYVLSQFNLAAGPELRIYKSTDGGKTFTLETKARTPMSGLGSVAVGQDGYTLHVVWSHSTSGIGSISYAQYDARAATWLGTDQVLFQGGATANDGFHWPDIDVGPDGNPVVVASTHRTQSWSGRMRFFESGQWSAPMPVNVDTYGVFLNVVADRRGDFHFAYRTNTGGYGIRYRRFDRASAAFGAEGEIQVFAGTSNASVLVVDEAGNKHVLYTKDQSLELATAPAQSFVFTSQQVAADATYVKGNLNYSNFALVDAKDALWIFYSYPSRSHDEIFGRLLVNGTMSPEVPIQRQAGRKYEWMSGYRRIANPLSRSFVFMSEDTAAGVKELWSLAAPAGFVPFGAGCAGTGGFVPFSASDGIPAVGSASFGLRLGMAKGGAPVVALLGTRDDNAQGIPLPFDLAAVGMPGCFLRNNLVLVVGGVASGTNPGEGTASLPVTIPNDMSLAGGRIFSQWLVVDPGVNAAGIATSGSGAAVVR